MPQMNPMNWLALFILFSATYFLVLVKVNFTMKNFSGPLGAIGAGGPRPGMAMMI